MKRILSLWLLFAIFGIGCVAALALGAPALAAQSTR